MPAVFKNTYSIIESYAEQNPEAAAIVAPGRGLVTYSDLLRHTREYSSALRSLGVRQNDKVAIVLPNGPEMAVTLFSVTASATSAPLNPDYQQGEFESYFSDLDIKLVITLSGLNTAAHNAAFIYNIPVLEILENNQQGPLLQNLLAEKYLVNKSENSPILSICADDVALVLLTSGTTSKPKIVPLTHQNIGVSVEYICKALQLGPGDRCLSMMPQFHIGGLVDLLLAPLARGGSVISTSGFDVSNFFEYLVQYKPTWYQAVPATLFELVSEAERTRDRTVEVSLRFIRSVSAPLQMQTLDRIEAYFGVPVIEVYGMTEAAPIITSNPLPPGERKRKSVGMSVGPELIILDSDGQAVEAGNSGEVVIRGENVISGYENNIKANQQAFINGWFHTGDKGHLDRDEYLFLDGRLNEVINRGGEKVSPQEVDTVLMDHPAVAQAITFPLPHKALGEDVAAAVVLHDEMAVEEEEILNFLSTRLADFKIPKRIVFVEDIPRGDTGKFQRIGLAEKIDLNTSRSFTLPETKLEKTLAKIWSDILGVDKVGRNDKFFNLGGYSLLAMRLVTEVERITGMPFPMKALTQSATLKSMARALEESKLSDLQPDTILRLSSPLVSNVEAFRRMQSAIAGGKFPSVKQGALLTEVNTKAQKQTGQPLFWCFNAPGREMTALATYMGADQPIYGMLAGSRVLRNLDIVNTAIAKHYAEEISTLFPDLSYNIGGNCRGADVASQVAYYLIDKGHTVNRLCLMEFFHPRLFDYPERMMLLYGKQSHITDYEIFNWGKAGWEDKFAVMPEVEWISGGHGEYFRNPNIRPLSERISHFMNNGNFHSRSLENE